MKKLFAGIAAVAVFATLAVAGPANAAPIPFSELTLKPHGKVYNTKSATTSADLNLVAGVMPGPGDTTLKPTITNDLGFPNYMTFSPDPKMPVCNDYKPEDDTLANQPYAQAIVGSCAKSIVGNGRSDLYIAGQVAALVTDSQIVNFNGGRDNQGRPVQYIHGYSQSTQAGVNIRATQINGRFVMDIARLSFDSSVPTFETNIPGPLGLDPDYVQVACPTGEWTAESRFTIANWDTVTGQPINQEIVQSDETTQPCTGVNPPKPKIKVKKVLGPNKVKANKKTTFKVKVKNTGKSTAKKVKVQGKGAAKGSSGKTNIPAGKTKTIKVKLKVKGKKGKKVTVKVKAKGNGTNASTGKKKVKLK
jgi:CARDB